MLVLLMIWNLWTLLQSEFSQGNASTMIEVNRSLAYVLKSSRV
jgi:hypothetical protein